MLLSLFACFFMYSITIARIAIFLGSMGETESFSKGPEQTFCTVCTRLSHLSALVLLFLYKQMEFSNMHIKTNQWHPKVQMNYERLVQFVLYNKPVFFLSFDYLLAFGNHSYHIPDIYVPGTLKKTYFFVGLCNLKCIYFYA